MDKEKKKLPKKAKFALLGLLFFVPVSVSALSVSYIATGGTMFGLLEPKQEINVSAVDENGNSKTLKIEANVENGSGELETVADITAISTVNVLGFADLTISPSTPYIALSNSNGAGIYLQYVLTDKNTGKTVFESDLIAAGKSYNLNLNSLLSEGEHTINFTITPYMAVEGGTCVASSGSSQDVKVTVSK